MIYSADEKTRGMVIDAKEKLMREAVPIINKLVKDNPDEHQFRHAIMMNKDSETNLMIGIQITFEIEEQPKPFYIGREIDDET